MRNTRSSIKEIDTLQDLSKRKSSRTITRKSAASWKKRPVIKHQYKPKTKPKSKTKPKKNPNKKPKGRTSHDSPDEENELFCICRQPYDPQRFMIGCDKCDGWFHAQCVNVTVNEAHRLNQFACPPCSNKVTNDDTDNINNSDAINNNTPSNKTINSIRKGKCVKRERPAESSPSPYHLPSSSSSSYPPILEPMTKKVIKRRRDQKEREKKERNRDLEPERDSTLTSPTVRKTTSNGTRTSAPTLRSKCRGSSKKSKGLHNQNNRRQGTSVGDIVKTLEDADDVTSEADSDIWLTSDSDEEVDDKGYIGTIETVEDNSERNRQSWETFSKTCVTVPPKSKVKRRIFSIEEYNTELTRSILKHGDMSIGEGEFSLCFKNKDMKKMSVKERDTILMRYLKKIKFKAECEFLELQKKLRLYKTGIAFARRQTIFKQLCKPLGHVQASPLLLGTNFKKFKSKCKIRERDRNDPRAANFNDKNMWIVILTCRGCLGHIPYSRFSQHLEDCALELSTHRSFKTAEDSISSEIPLLVCGSPLGFEKEFQSIEAERRKKNKKKNTKHNKYKSEEKRKYTKKWTQ